MKRILTFAFLMTLPMAAQAPTPAAKLAASLNTIGDQFKQAGALIASLQKTVVDQTTAITALTAENAALKAGAPAAGSIISQELLDRAAGLVEQGNQIIGLISLPAGCSLDQNTCARLAQ